jgi:hypothetical protein
LPPSTAAASAPLPVTQPLNDDSDSGFSQNLGGASDDKSNIDIDSAVTAAEALAAESGELARFAFQLPERDSTGKAFYEYSPVNGADPGWRTVEQQVRNILSEVARTPTSGGARTKAAKSILWRVATFVTGHTSDRDTASSVTQQRKFLRGYAAMLRHVAPGYMLKKLDIVDLFPNEKAADDALSTEPLTVDLLGDESQ